MDNIPLVTGGYKYIFLYLPVNSKDMYLKEGLSFNVTSSRSSRQYQSRNKPLDLHLQYA